VDDRFKIYVEQLRHGHVEKLDESFSPEFLDVNDSDLVFAELVTVSGEAYLADDILILHLDIGTMARIPCAVCNAPVDVPIEIKGAYHAVPLEEVKGSIFNFKELLRETILLEVPQLAECEQGKCPKREEIRRYLVDPKKDSKQNPEEGYHPFADLDLDK
jgi:uncharacterized metal-binding protein YceD (DUF177 family)